MELLLYRGKVALERGSKYGEAGLGYLRLNVTCPRSVLAEGIDRITRALTAAKKEQQ